MLGLGNTITGGAALSWDPKELGETLVVWYKNDTDITNLSGTDGTSANRMQWADQSGGNRHAQQDTTADKPGDGSVVEGGMDFELDTTDYMNIAAGDGALDFGHDPSTPANGVFTMLFAIKRETHSVANTLIGSGTTEFLGFSSSDDKVKFRTTGTNAAVTTITFDSSNLWSAGSDLVLTVTKDTSGNLLFYKNSDNVVESGGGTSQNVGQELDLTILGSKQGTSNNFDGIIKEVIICNTLLKANDRLLAQNYLIDKFSIA